MKLGPSRKTSEFEDANIAHGVFALRCISPCNVSMYKHSHFISQSQILTLVVHFHTVLFNFRQLSNFFNLFQTFSSVLILFHTFSNFFL